MTEQINKRGSIISPENPEPLNLGYRT